MFGVYSDLVTCELITVSCPCGFRLNYPVFRDDDELEERLARANPLELQAAFSADLGRAQAEDRARRARNEQKRDT